jgi:hypothetical protein
MDEDHAAQVTRDALRAAGQLRSRLAGHRDSVSELVGDALESAIERQLHRWGGSNHKTKRAKKVRGFLQSPDFIIPSWANPRVIIEAEVTEDDGPTPFSWRLAAVN